MHTVFLSLLIFIIFLSAFSYFSMLKFLSKPVKGEDGSIGLLLRIALPLIITTSSSSLMQFVDRMFLAWYSADTLAACLPSGIMSFAVISFFMGTCGYTSVFIANYYGQKRYASLSVALWQGVLLGALSGVIIACFVPLGNYIITLSSHAPEIKILEKQYFTILALFGGFVVVNNALAAFFSGQGKTAVTMVVNLLGNGINVFLTYAMIFGKFGFQEQGIRGAAYSTIISNIFITIIFLSLIFSPQIRRKFKTWRLFGFNKKFALRLIKYGLPNGFGFFMDIFSFSVFAFFTGNIDKISLAASNIVLTLESVVFMPMLGLALANQILMGQYVGKKQVHHGVKSTFNTLKIGSVYVAFMICCFLLFPDFFVQLFAGSHDVAGTAMGSVLDSARPLLKVLCLFTLGDLAYLTFGDAIKGAGDTKFHMKAMIAASFFLVIGSYVMVNVLHMSIGRVWFWITGYAWSTGAIMMWRFLSRRWQGIDITK